jgi:hypothetical protein
MSDRRSTSPRISRRTLGSALLTGGTALALPTAVLTFAPGALASEWHEIDDAYGIKVYKKDVPGSKLHAFRGVGLVDAPMEKIIWVLGDNTHRTEWVDRLKKSVILEQKGDYEFIVYQHFGSPAVIADRDFVYRAQAYSRKDGTAVLDIQSVTHPKAPATVGVRGELNYSSYVLKRVGKKTLVDVSVSLDPKGALPGWIVNMVQKSWPMNTLKALREHVKKPFVRTLAAPPVR